MLSLINNQRFIEIFLDQIVCKEKYDSGSYITEFELKFSYFDSRLYTTI